MAGNLERTYLMIKPDGVQRGLVGEIIKRFEQKGFKLVALKFVQVCRFFCFSNYVIFPSLSYIFPTAYWGAFAETLCWFVCPSFLPRPCQVHGVWPSCCNGNILMSFYVRPVLTVHLARSGRVWTWSKLDDRCWVKPTLLIPSQAPSEETSVSKLEGL